MRCPNCDCEMEPGYIPGPKDLGVLWVPEAEKIPPVISSGYIERVNGIRLASPTWLLPGIPKAGVHVCRKCRVGMLSF